MKKQVKILPVMLLALVASVSCGKTDEKGGEAEIKDIASFIASFEDGDIEEVKMPQLFKSGVIDAADGTVKQSTHLASVDSSLYGYYTDGLEEEEKAEYVQKLYELDTFTAFENDVVMTKTDYMKYSYDAAQVFAEKLDEDTGRNYYACDGYGLVPTEYTDTTLIFKDEGNMKYVFNRNEISNPYSFSATKPVNDGIFDKVKTSGGIGLDTLECYESLADALVSYKSAWGPKYRNEESFSAKKEGKKLKVESYLSFYTGSLISCQRAAIDYNWTSDGQGKGFEGLYMRQGRTFGYEITFEGNIVTDAIFYYDATFRIVYRDLNWKSGDPAPSDLYIEDETPYDLVIAESYGDKENTFVDTHSYIYLDEYETYQATTKPIGTYLGEYPDADMYREYALDDVGSAYFEVLEFTDEK